MYKDDNAADPMATTDQTIAEYASGDPNFSILVQALAKADLVDVLNGSGNFTVFAPTNAAFNALFSTLGVTGIADLSAETLTPILLYHVLGTEKKASVITSGYYATLSPAEGNFASMNISVSGGVNIDKDTKVTTADVDVKNGVIHVIDKVLLPPSVVDIALETVISAYWCRRLLKPTWLKLSALQVLSRFLHLQMLHLKPVR